jgi:hypothetical protein
METIDEAAITNHAPLPNQGIAEHESFTPSTDDCRRDTFFTEVARIPRLFAATGELLTAHEHGTLSNPGN